MSPTQDQIAQLAAGRVLVVGDVMVDHYVSGRVSRVSDEAPVPIIHVSDERWTPGGAANVAANIAALGGKAVLAGVAGADPAAATLTDVLSRLGAIEVHLTADAGRPTTIKTRYMGGQHQIVRVDREQPAPISKASEDKLVASIEKLAPGCGAIMISDYSKGALTDRVLAAAIAAGRKAGVPVVVDPKRADWSTYRGASLITPNRKELQLATQTSCGSDAECAAAAAIAIRTTGAAILLTRSEQGMSLFREAAALHLSAKAREVFDVSGAGDTVAAAAALGLASGQKLEAAMQIANIAAGIVVAKRGTATASPAELLAEIGAGSSRGIGGAPGALPLSEVKRIRQGWEREGLSVGFTNGCFDILHAGHVSLLRQAASACDRLIVALNTDASVRALKGVGRPVQSEGVRAAVMAAVKGVDAVVLFGEATPAALIRDLQPDVLVKGADYSEDQIVGADIVRARGGRIVRVSLVDGQSTTKIIDKSRGGG